MFREQTTLHWKCGDLRHDGTHLNATNRSRNQSLYFEITWNIWKYTSCIAVNGSLNTCSEQHASQDGTRKVLHDGSHAHIERSLSRKRKTCGGHETATSCSSFFNFRNLENNCECWDDWLRAGSRIKYGEVVTCLPHKGQRDHYEQCWMQRPCIQSEICYEVNRMPKSVSRKGSR